MLQPAIMSDYGIPILQRIGTARACILEMDMLEPLVVAEERKKFCLYRKQVCGPVNRQKEGGKKQG